MKQILYASIVLVSVLGMGQAIGATSITSPNKNLPAGCKPNCDGIAAGKCSCVSIDHYTCCGKRIDGIKANTQTKD